MVGTNLGPNYDLARRISALEKTVAGLATRDVLQNSSISAGGLLVNGGGSIEITGGGSLDITGGGSVNISGGGEAFVNGLQLSSVQPASGGLSASGWSASTSSTAVATCHIGVPAGYGTALVMSVCQLDVYNNSSAAQYVYASTDIGSAGGAESLSLAAVDTAVSITPAAIQSLDVSGLSSFPVTAQVRASAALGATASNVATVNVIAIFIE